MLALNAVAAIERPILIASAMYLTGIHLALVGVGEADEESWAGTSLTYSGHLITAYRSILDF